MPTQELSITKLPQNPPDAWILRDQLSVPSTEQLLLFHGPELFASVVTFSPVGHLVVAIDGRILRVNDVFSQLTGYHEQALVGMTLVDLVDPDSRTLTEEMLERMLRRRETAVDWNAVVCQPSGRPVELALNGVVVSSAGLPRYITILVRGGEAVERTPAVPSAPVVPIEPDSNDTFRSLVERIPAVTYITTLAEGGGTFYISPQVSNLLGYDQEEWLAQPSLWLGVVHPDDRAVVDDAIRRGRDERTGYRIEHRVIARDGQVFWVRNEAALMADDASETAYWHGVMYDITERKKLEEKLGNSEARFRSLVQNSSSVVLVVSPNGTIHYASPALTAWLGPGTTSPVPGESCLTLLHPDDVGRFREFLSEAAGAAGVSPVIEVRFVDALGGVRHIEAIATNLLSDPNVGGLVLNTRDVTERKDLERNLSHQAFHDALTDLPNRSLFLDRVGHALERAARQDRLVAVLYLDIDNFKLINDNQGHDVGDQLLVTVASRLRECVRAVDTVARFGGDEFTVLLEDPEDMSVVIEVAGRISKSLCEPVVLPDQEVTATVSIGIAHNVNRQTSPQDLLSSADIALYRAKNLGKARFAVFERGMTAPIHERLALEHDLKRAIDMGEFEVYFQPLVELENGFVCCVEALVRWHHPARGLLLPEDFVGLSESTGLIVKLGEQVLEQSCRQVKEWQTQDRTTPPLALNVNLSSYQFRHPTIVEDIIGILERSGLAPGSLIIEINESLITENPAHAISVLQAIKRAGIRLFIDDFGTGYSSLSFLKRFPVDGIKVDRSLIDGIERDAPQLSMVAAIIAAGQALHLNVVAEGIETIGQLAELRGLGCPSGQGHLFAAPGPAGEISSFIRRRVLLPQVRFKREQPRRTAE
jgi:diguanylate cyclase (GGDEF)-like protein/PAS domain S-box-containing protein